MPTTRAFVDTNVFALRWFVLFQEAVRIYNLFQISYWDAAIVAAAKRLGATILYSEDLSDGREFRGRPSSQSVSCRIQRELEVILFFSSTPTRNNSTQARRRRRISNPPNASNTPLPGSGTTKFSSNRCEKSVIAKL